MLRFVRLSKLRSSENRLIHSREIKIHRKLIGFVILHFLTIEQNFDSQRSILVVQALVNDSPLSEELGDGAQLKKKVFLSSWWSSISFLCAWFPINLYGHEIDPRQLIYYLHEHRFPCMKKVDILVKICAITWDSIEKFGQRLNHRLRHYFVERVIQ